MWKIDTIFQKTIVYEGLQYGGKQKSVAILEVDLEIWWCHSLKINKCRHFETNQNIRKLPRQIYIQLLKVSFKQSNWKRNATEFYTHHFKDLSSMLLVGLRFRVLSPLTDEPRFETRLVHHSQFPYRYCTRTLHSTRN